MYPLVWRIFWNIKLFHQIALVCFLIVPQLYSQMKCSVSPKSRARVSCGATSYPFHLTNISCLWYVFLPPMKVLSNFSPSWSHSLGKKSYLFDYFKYECVIFNELHIFCKVGRKAMRDWWEEILYPCENWGCSVNLPAPASNEEFHEGTVQLLGFAVLGLTLYIFLCPTCLICHLKHKLFRPNVSLSFSI